MPKPLFTIGRIMHARQFETPFYSLPVPRVLYHYLCYIDSNKQLDISISFDVVFLQEGSQ